MTFLLFLSLRKDQLQGPHKDTSRWCLPDLLTLRTPKVKKPRQPNKEPKQHQVKPLLDCKAPEKIYSPSQIPCHVGGPLREWCFPFRSTLTALAEGTGASEAMRGKGVVKQTSPEASSPLRWACGVGERKGDVKHVSENLISLSHTPSGNSWFAIKF